MEIAQLLAASRFRPAYRAFLGLHDDLLRAEPSTRVALCVTPPVLVGDRRYDALIAALVEHDLERDGLPIPPWAKDSGRHAEGWWVEDLPGRRHGIWLDAAELESV